MQCRVFISKLEVFKSIYFEVFTYGTVLEPQKVSIIKRRILPHDGQVSFFEMHPALFYHVPNLQRQFSIKSYM